MRGFGFSKGGTDKLEYNANVCSRVNQITVGLGIANITANVLNRENIWFWLCFRAA